MKNLFVCMSHKLTPAQRQGWDKVALISESLNAQTRAISPRASEEEINQLAQQVVGEATESGATHLFVAGEPLLVLCCTMQAASKGLTVVQSTTERVSEDQVQPDGTVKKVSVFNHVQWREVNIFQNFYRAACKEANGSLSVWQR